MSYLSKEQRAQLAAIRKTLDGFVAKIVDSTIEINDNMPALRKWKPGVFAVNDVRMHIGIPYKCVQAHDSTANEAWSPDATPALWMQYHGTSKETARAWVQPTGAHDMYKANEYMIWTDGNTYRCVMDTVYSPADYAAVWEIV
jgi:hypothetical protein